MACEQIDHFTPKRLAGYVVTPSVNRAGRKRAGDELAVIPALEDIRFTAHVSQARVSGKVRRLSGT
jgi:hypothetical protein